MNNKDKLKAIKYFLDWMENCTNYEIGIDEQSDWGDGESTFHRVDFKDLFKEYQHLVLLYI